MNDKTKKFLAIAAPMLIGTAIILILNRNPKKKKSDSVLDDSTKGSFTPISSGTSSSSFPIQKGSKGAYVSQFQEVLNAYGAGLKVDGNWGPLTDVAAKSKLNITSVESKQQLDALIAQVKASGQASINIANEAQQALNLSVQWNANTSLRLMVKKALSAAVVKVDYQGKVTGTGEHVNIPANTPLSRSEYKPYAVDPASGLLVVKYATGLWGMYTGYCLFRPSQTTLV